MFYKRFFCILLLIMILPLSCNAIDVDAGAAVLMDSVTGKVLYGKNMDTKMGMASTTKIMTAILAIEKGNLDDMVKVSDNAVGVEGSSMYLEKDETISLRNLLYGLMLNSGNDASVAIAEHISGSVDEFAKLMTQKAKDIGAVNTNFKNPHGLYDIEHYTTAYDLALITLYAMQNSEFEKIAATKSWVVPLAGKNDRYYYNKNKLLNMYNGADGVKPGYTPETGRTLVGSATRNGWKVITVTLNCKNDWAEHSKMFDYAFNTYELRTIVGKGANLSTIPVKNGADNEVPIIANDEFKLPILKGSNANISIEIPKEPHFLSAPIKKDTKVADVVVKVDNEQVAMLPVVTKYDIEKQQNTNIISSFCSWVANMFGF